MSKSFNDDELTEIMKEIEALEEDFSEDGHVASSVMAELAEMATEKSVPHSTSNVVSLDSKRTASTAMSFKVQGELSLELQFEIGGKVVALEVTQTGLTIEMEGGMKFTVPVDGTSPYKKAV
jgi:hypothetical protein